MVKPKYLFASLIAVVPDSLALSHGSLALLKNESLWRSEKAGPTFAGGFLYSFPAILA